ncbi:hypothetical protein P9112_000201 [Eukaryota sp. TZLM1-RC]
MTIKGFLYDKFMSLFERKLGRALRSQLCDGISGRVLDIGSGTGANLPYIKKSADQKGDFVEVVSVDPSSSFNSVSEKRAADLGLHHTIVETMFEEYSSSQPFDYIISSLTMCSCADLERYTLNALSLLKPGGEFRFLEHTYSYRPLLRYLQTVIDKITHFLTQKPGHLTRPIVETIESSFPLCTILEERNTVFPICRFVLGVGKSSF